MNTYGIDYLPHQLSFQLNLNLKIGIIKKLISLFVVRGIFMLALNLTFAQTNATCDALFPADGLIPEQIVFTDFDNSAFYDPCVIMDGATNTRFKGQSLNAATPGIITIDLGEEKSFTEIKIAWNKSSERSEAFRIEISGDGGANPEELFDTQSLVGLTNRTFQTFNGFGIKTVRYIKYIVSTSNFWNEPTEIQILNTPIPQYHRPTRPVTNFFLQMV